MIAQKVTKFLKALTFIQIFCRVGVIVWNLIVVQFSFSFSSHQKNILISEKDFKELCVRTWSNSFLTTGYNSTRLFSFLVLAYYFIFIINNSSFVPDIFAVCRFDISWLCRGSIMAWKVELIKPKLIGFHQNIISSQYFSYPGDF